MVLIGLGRVGLGVALIAGWQLVWGAQILPQGSIASPTAVAATLGSWIERGILQRAIPVTLFEAAAGFGAGSFAGAIVALILSRFRGLGLVWNPLISVFNAVPGVILIPLFTLWFGLGPTSKVVGAAVLVFFAVYFNVSQGLREVDSILVQNVRILGASGRQVISDVLFPATTFWILGSIRLAIGLAFLGAVAGEYLGGNEGVGFLIAQGVQTIRVQDVLAGMTVVASIVLSIDLACSRFASRFAMWRLF